MSTQALDARMQRVLQQIVLTAGDVSSGLKIQSGRTAPGSRLLTASERPPAEQLAREYAYCHNDAERLEAIEGAEAVLRHYTHSSGHTPDSETPDGRLRIGRDTRPIEIVAHAYGYSVKHVYKLRKEAAAEDERIAEGRERIRYDGTATMRLMIAASPGSSHTVAEHFDVSHTSVARWRRNIATEG